MDAPDTPKSTIKFLCSYGGKILPRYPDGKLRYLGGHTRVLAVDQSIPFSELLVKLGELCGSAVSLRCQLPTEDLDALVSITSDEDLASLMEEYERVDSPPSSLKIRAFLSPPKPLKRVSNDSSSSLSRSSSLSSPSSSSSSSSSSRSATAGSSRFGSSPRKSMLPLFVNRCVRQVSPPTVYPIGMGRSAPLAPQYAYHAQRNHRHVYLIHNGQPLAIALD